MTGDRHEYRERVAALSAAKKALLRKRVARLTDVAAPTGGRLIACLLARDGEVPDSDLLREYCRQRLPEYMLPQHFATVDELPRTPAGKVDRSLLQARNWQTQSDGIATTVAPRNAIEARLAAIWADVLGCDDVGVHDDFFEVGGDSLLSIRILSRAGKAGLSITPEAFFSHPTIAGQADVASVAPTVKAETGVITGVLPLMPIQHWFFERVTADPHHWNQSLLFALHDGPTRAVLERTAQKLLLHHDALRTRFTRGDSGWQARIDEPHGEPPVSWIDLAGRTDVEREACIEELATQFNGGFDLSVAPLIRFAWFDFGPGAGGRLLIVAHHLIVDAESWRLLLADFETLCAQLARGEPARPPAKTTSIKTWSSRLYDHGGSDALRAQADYWTARAGLHVPSIPRDLEPAPRSNTEAAAATVTATLDRETTQVLLRELPQRHRGRINDALVSALARVVGRWTEAATVRFDMEGHGREALFDDVDVSRTVGWFTTVFPVTLQVEDAAVWTDALAALRAVKEALRALPLNGLSHGLLCHGRDDGIASAMVAQPRAEILFNYLGQTDQADGPRMRLMNARCGPARSGRANRAYLLEINAQLSDGRLNTEWRYSTSSHVRATAERLAGEFLDALRELAHGGVAAADNAHTPSDFPLAGLDQVELDVMSDLLDDLDDNG